MTDSALLRLDKWLWRARLCKTRGLAQALIEAGHVAVNGATVLKSSVSVRPGDEISAVLGPVRRTLMVKSVGTRRGPAAEARALYDERDQAPVPRDERPVPRYRRA